MATTTEITGKQTISYLYDSNEIERNPSDFGTYAAYRVLRKDPTVALGRGLLVSGVLAGGWSIESDEGTSDDIIELVKNLLPLRKDLMKNAVGFGRVDFGWMPFEKIFMVIDGRITMRLKPLLHDITTILIDGHGNFNGYRQSNVQTTIPIDLPVEQCLHIAFDVEGSDHYGVPLLENIRAIQASWDDCDAGAKRYDQKIAGSHWIVHYPPGNALIDGETVENADVAEQVLEHLKSSGGLTLPSTTAEYVQELNDSAVAKLYKWDVKLISDVSSRQPAFSDRLKYLDSLKIRGLILPERSMLEGQYGTKAEAGEHIGLAITHMEGIDTTITRIVNEQVVEPLLALNFGTAAVHKARLVAAPLVDLKIEFLRKLYLALAPNETGTVDTTALKEALSVPIKEGQEQQELS